MKISFFTYDCMEKNKLSAEKILPYNDTTSKGEQVETMFDSIAEKYDLLNHTLSFGIDKLWRKSGINMLKKDSPKKILDVATGTGDLAIQAYKQLHPDHILGIDISDGMMEVGRRKVAGLGLSEHISFEKQDCMNLQLEDDRFDAVMVAFGVRNFENLRQGLKEIRRVLKPGGKLMILELTTPRSFPMKQLYAFYSKIFIPSIGKLVSQSNEAYTYLPRTIEAFVQGEEMKHILLECGFSDARYKKYTLGVCTMYFATK